MCEKCIPLDKQIEHYKSIRSGITDRQTLEAIEQLLAQLEGKKKALHPDE